MIKIVDFGRFDFRKLTPVFRLYYYAVTARKGSYCASFPPPKCVGSSFGLQRIGIRWNFPNVCRIQNVLNIDLCSIFKCKKLGWIRTKMCTSKLSLLHGIFLIGSSNDLEMEPLSISGSDQS